MIKLEIPVSLKVSLALDGYKLSDAPFAEKCGEDAFSRHGQSTSCSPEDVVVVVVVKKKEKKIMTWFVVTIFV